MPDCYPGRRKKHCYYGYQSFYRCERHLLQCMCSISGEIPRQKVMPLPASLLGIRNESKRSKLVSEGQWCWSVTAGGQRPDQHNWSEGMTFILTSGTELVRRDIQTKSSKMFTLWLHFFLSCFLKWDACLCTIRTANCGERVAWMVSEKWNCSSDYFQLFH